MEYIRLTKENLEKEHICCAISSNKDPQVMSKKAWLRERLDEGLVFLKADARGKCFIEYMPAEAAWAPIAADGYLYIDCFWVSGSLPVLFSSSSKTTPPAVLSAAGTFIICLFSDSSASKGHTRAMHLQP